jgi:hypothetical protein
MNIIPSRDFRINPGKVWNLLKTKEDIIVTLNGKPIALLSDINENDIEEALYISRKIKAEIALSKIRKRAKKFGLDKLSMEEIDSEIRKKRQGK